MRVKLIIMTGRMKVVEIPAGIVITIIETMPIFRQDRRAEPPIRIGRPRRSGCLFV